MDEQNEGSRAVDRWLVSDRVLLRRAGKYIEEAAAIGITEARITSVCSAEALRSGALGESSRRRETEIIDVGARPIAPAFVNGHTHLALAPLRGITSLASRNGNVVVDTFFRFEKCLTKEDVRVFTRLAAFESALFGVGQVWDHYYFGEQVARGLAEAGLSGVVAPTLQDRSGPGSARWEEELEATSRIHFDEALRRAGIRAALGPHATDTVSDELFGKIGEMARHLDAPVHMHLMQSFEEVLAGRDRRFLKKNGGLVDALSKTRLLLAHGLYLNDEDVADWVARGTVLAYCPYSQLQFGFLGPVASWLRAGGGLALGTDCVASNDALDVQRETPLLGGAAALLASFGRARKEYSSGAPGAEEKAIEDRRQALVGEFDIAEPDRLLDVLFGAHLAALKAEPFGIAEGALAQLLVFDPDDPSFFPGDDLPRTLAYGQTSGAIELSVMAGTLVGQSEGHRREILRSESYRETLSEARRRRDELLARVRTTRAPSSS